jgi:outer membrane biosynthesis protein TonB
MLDVKEPYRRQGLAAAMYNFARSLGNDIVPGTTQTDMGQAFWKGGAGLGKETEFKEIPKPATEPEKQPEPKPKPKIEPKAEPKKPLGWMQRFKNILTPEPA